MHKTFFPRLRAHTLQNSLKTGKVNLHTAASKIAVGMSSRAVLSMVRNPDEVVYCHNIISPGGPVFPDFTWIWKDESCLVEVDFLKDRVLKVNVSLN